MREAQSSVKGGCSESGGLFLPVGAPCSCSCVNSRGMAALLLQL